MALILSTIGIHAQSSGAWNYNGSVSWDGINFVSGLDSPVRPWAPNNVIPGGVGSLLHFNNDITTTAATRWDKALSTFTGNLPNGTKVRLTSAVAPFVANTDYFVVNATGSTFQLSGSVGGGSIAITAAGNFGATNYTTPDNSVLAGTKSIYLDGARTVGQLVIGDLSGAERFSIEAGNLPSNNLIFDMGTSGGGNTFINKFQGGLDFITAPIVLNDDLNVRITTQILELQGAMSGAGTLTSYGNGRLKISGDSTISTVPLWLWNRGTNNVNNNAQVELAATVGNAIGGAIQVGNASLGGNGHAVLQLQQGRVNLNQIKDTVGVTFDGINGRWAYMKLMGGNETVESIMDLTSGAVIENRESETLSTAATLTINGTSDSRISAYLRNNAYNPYASLDPTPDATELTNYNTAPLSLAKQGTSTLSLVGTNIYYGGTTTVSGGTLLLDGTTRFRSNITNNAAVIVNFNSGTWNFNYDHDGDQTLTNAPVGYTPTALVNLSITGSGSLTKTGLGIFNLASNNTFGGGVRVTEGGLVLGGNNTITGGITVSGEPTIDRDLTLSGTNNIGSAFNVIGDYGAAASTVTITGAQTLNSGSPASRVVSFTNTTAILNGTLGRIANAASITLSGRAGTSGIFRLDNSTDSNADRVTDTTTFISKGGTFNYLGGAGTDETMGQLNLNSGELQIAHDGIGKLTFASLARTTGATLRVDGVLGMGTANQQVKFTASPSSTNGILGAWATVGKEWAAYGGNGLFAFGSYSTGAESTWVDPVMNVKASASQTLGNNRIINSLNLQAAGNVTVTVNAPTRVLSISSGGILAGSADATGRTHTFNNGIVTVPSTYASSGAELITTVHTGTLNFNSVIDESFSFTGTKSTSNSTITGVSTTAGVIIGMRVEGLGIPANTTVTGVTGTTVTLSNTPTTAGATSLTFTSGNVGVTKTGNGLLVLNGTNHYLGKTIVNQGTLRISSEVNLGDNPTSMDASHLLVNGGVIQFNSSMTFDDANRGITIGDAGGRFEVGTANGNIFTVNLNTPIVASGVLEVAVRGDQSVPSSSILNLGNNSSSNTFAGGLKTEQFTGLTNVNGSNTIGHIFVEAGEISLNGANTLTGNIRINAGKLSLKEGNTFTGKVTMTGGEISLFNVNSLGSAGFDLALGNGTLSLNGTNQTLNTLTGNTSSVIQNGEQGNFSQSIVTMNMGYSTTFSGAINDGGMGTLGLTKIGAGTLLLNNLQSNFTEPLRIAEGVVATTFMDYGGNPSPIGAGNSEPQNLVISGGGLRFDLTVPVVTDRSFTLGSGAQGGTLAAAGTTREATVTFGVDYSNSAFPYSSPAMAFEGSGERTLTLAGFQAGYNIMNVPFGDKSPSEPTSLMKIGAGYWEIGRPNAFTGLTTVQEGRLAISADGALGTYVPSAATTVSIASGNYSFSGNLTNGTAIHIAATSLPAGVSATNTYYVINSTGSTFQISDSPASFPVTVTSTGSGVTYSSSQGAGVNLIGGALELKGVNYQTPETLLMEGGQLFAQTGTNTWAGPVSVNVNSTVNVLEGASIEFTGVLSGNRGITQAGEGTVILSGEADPLAVGAVDNNRRFYSLNAGTLILDYTNNNNSKLVDGASLTLGGSRRGGTIRLVGGSHEEIVAGTTIATGENAIYREAGSTAILRLNTISRQPGATIYFDQPNIAKVDNINTTANILGAWAIVRDVVNGDYDWAKNAGTADGLVIANSTYNTLTWAANANTNVTTTNTRTANQTTYTLRFNGPNGASLPTSDVVLTLSGGVNTIQSGGVLVTPKMLTFNSIIRGAGDITMASEQQIPDFLINQFNPSGNLVIENRLVDDPNQPGATGTLFNGDTRRISGLNSALVANMHVGMSVSGTGIPVGATITGFYSATDIQINTAYTGAANDAVPDLTFVAHNGLEKLGVGTLILTGASTYTGVTTIANGVLTAGLIADGGLPSSLGASSNAAGNLVFNGGTLRYIGEDSSTNRGFTVNEFARFEVGHEQASLTMTGTVSGADRIEVGGPGTLVLTGAATGTTHWLLDDGAAEFRMNTGNNRFASSLADLTVSGGALRIVGDTAADRVQQFGGQFTVAEGPSEIRAISEVGGVAGRAITIQIGGVDEIFPVIRNAGGTVSFVEDPVANGGAANITLALPVIERATILPYATYLDTSNLSQRGVNNFATVDISNTAIVSADFLSLHDIGSFYNDPNNWTGAVVNPSEGANGGFNGTLSANRTVGTLRYFAPVSSSVQVPTGRVLRIANGGVMVGANVGAVSKQISGAGSLTGGLRSADGGRDLIWHNYNQASTFLIGTKIIDDSIQIVGLGGLTNTGANITANSTSMTIGFGSASQFTSLAVGMTVTGTGIAPGTTIEVIDPLQLGITLSQPATATISGGSFSFVAVTNFLQSGIGTTALAGTNTYSGQTFVHGGVLRLDSANAVPGGIGVAGGTSGIVIEGGVVGLNSGDFTRAVGTGVAQVQFKGSGGFAAFGADRIVNFGGNNALLAWGVNGFVPVGSSLVLGSHDSTHKVTITNPLVLGYGSQVVRAENGLGAVDGELSGVISGTAQLVKRGYGELRLSGINTYTGGTALEQGSLVGANSANAFGAATGSIEVGATSFADVRGQLTVGMEGGTVVNPVHVGNINTEGNSMVRFGNDGTLSGAVTLDRNVFIGAVGTTTRGILSGVVSGAGGLTVVSTGNVILSNAANSFGTGGSAPGNVIDGSAIVRSGNLVVGATGALGSSTVELGDALPGVFTVDRATVGQEMTLKGGFFDPLHNGAFTGSGPGAFVEVNNVIDGRTFTRVDAGVQILVKDNVVNPEWNGVYRVVFYDIPVNSPDPQPANTMNLVRISGMDGAGEFLYGTRVIVANGTVNAGKSFFIAGTAVTPNVSAVHFREDVNNPNAGLLVESGGVTVANPVDVNSTLGAGSARIGGSDTMTTGSSSFTGPVTLRDLQVGVRESMSLQLNSVSTDNLGVVFGGLISEANGGAGATTDVLTLVKIGAGRATLTGANTYHGGTTVSAGTLMVNNISGSATGSGVVTLSPGATLAGTGTIGGDVMLLGAVGNPSSIAPGDPSVNGGIGTLTISGDVNFGANTGALFTIRGNGDNDLLVASHLIADATTLFHILFDGTYSPTLGDTFDFINWGSAPSTGDIELTDNLDLPALPAALFWDTSLFNTTGVLSLVDAILPPSIVTPPQSQAVNPGATVLFEVVPGGSGPFTYQWKKNGINISGATKRTLTLTAVTQASEGSYTVVVTNVAGPTTSDPGILMVNDPILITSQPTTQVKFDGELATFTVVATGTGPITYQWQKDGFDIPFATADQYTTSVNAGTLGIYRVKVTNVVGQVVSNNAALAFAGPDAAILLDPVPAMLPVGGTLDLSVIAQGDAPLAYQWKRNNAVLKGATATNYMVTNVTTARAGAYNCVVTNTVGGIKKTATSLVVQVGVVDQTSKNFVLKVGSKVTLSVTAVGNNLTYQWMKDNVDLPGKNAKTLPLTGLAVTDSGDYVCRVGRSGEPEVLGVSMQYGGTNNLRVYDSAPVVTHTPPLPPAVVSGTYSYQFPVDPEINLTPTAFVASGLPTGLTINKTTGLISGKPTVWKADPYVVKVTVSNLVNKVTVTTSLQVSDLAGTFVGSFAGPIDRNDALNGGLGGFFTLTSAKSGIISGKLVMGAATYSYKGSLDTTLATPTEATATVVVARSKMTPLTLTFTINSSLGQITVGSITDGVDTANFTGWRNQWSKTNPTTVFNGTYVKGTSTLTVASAYHTFALSLPVGSPLIGDATIPQGDGFASFSIASTTGALKISGKTADGQAILFSTFVGPGGEVGLFKTLYTTSNRGSLLGTLTISATTPAEQNLLGGTVSWSRPALPVTSKERAYKDGFGVANPVSLSAIGGRYVAPVSPAVILGIDIGVNPTDNATLEFVGADVGTPAPSPDINVTVIAGSKLSLPLSGGPLNLRKTSLTVSPTTGAISGKFTIVEANPLFPTTSVTRSVAYQGLIVRDVTGQHGRGYFLLPQLPSISPETPTTTKILSGLVTFDKQ